MEKKEADKKKKDQEQKNKNQEPSEFAKKLKAKADELVSQKLYKQAYDLMIDGLKKDQTVSSFQNFIDRTKEVIDIK
jgi:TolA-binding protein